MHAISDVRHSVLFENSSLGGENGFYFGKEASAAFEERLVLLLDSGTPLEQETLCVMLRMCAVSSASFGTSELTL